MLHKTALKATHIFLFPLKTWSTLSLAILKAFSISEVKLIHDNPNNNPGDTAMPKLRKDWATLQVSLHLTCQEPNLA